ncbi:hypothetical protein NONI108955_21195 [Nocardia ninae]|uniref:Uncharacterized protein n=1 Tax=Nocardia ninae NBRC 108245 TaxID=1210091 RepID=A0A511MAE1_9NOCA|nr:hypothetical protein [Nocardia ninae]GEM37471.1 hypothetical protein NN4_19900 [Nocardia ninae NBRC 108245]
MMTSDKTEHQAKSVGDGGWVVSFLPGRTLTVTQAADAMKAAEAVETVRALTESIGLTVLETVGLVIQEQPWPPPLQPRRCGLRLFPQR